MHTCRTLFLLLLALSGKSAMAGLYPVVTDITTSTLGNSLIYYNFKQTLVELGPDTERIVYNPMAIGLTHRHILPGQNIDDALMHTPTGQWIYASVNGDSIGSIARSLYNVNKNIGQISHYGNIRVPECIGYVAGRPGLSWNQVIAPAGACIEVPPGEQWCKLLSPALTLNHGVISLTDVATSTAKDTLRMECSTGTTVRLRLNTNEVYVPLAPSGRAWLSIDGKKPGELFKLPSGVSTLPVTDRLEGINSSGNYEGMSVLIIEPM